MQDDPQTSLTNLDPPEFLPGTASPAVVMETSLPAHAGTTTGESASDAELVIAAKIEGAVSVVLRINGKDHRLRVDPRTKLLDCIRETVALTGTKKGCDHGQCGACTVHVTGRRVNSRLSLGLMHDGNEITTIEGLGTPEAMHPMQAAFVACDGY